MSDTTDTTNAEGDDSSMGTLFELRTAAEILDAIDVEAMLADEPARDPVDGEQLADAAGRILAERLVSGSGATGFVKRYVAHEVGGRAAQVTIQAVVDRVGERSIGDSFETFDERTPGPAVGDAVRSSLGVPAAADVETGGVHDATGDDHTGALGSDDGTN
jgi:hypothetical protein